MIRRGIEFYNQRAIDKFMDLAHPDIEWTSAFAAMEGGGFQGHEGFRRYFEEIASVWDEFELIPREFVDAGDAVVVDVDRRAARVAAGIPA